MNERLKRLRKELSLNQKELGDKIKLSQTHISSLENGAREMTDRIVYDICRELNVNENWLRNGKGEIFVENDSAIITELASEYHLDAIDQLIIEHYVRLDADDRQAIKDHVVTLAKKISNLEESAASTEMNIDEEVESYRRELEAEQKKAMSSASDGLKGRSS